MRFLLLISFLVGYSMVLHANALRITSPTGTEYILDAEGNLTASVHQVTTHVGTIAPVSGSLRIVSENTVQVQLSNDLVVRDELRPVNITPPIAGDLRIYPDDMADNPAAIIGAVPNASTGDLSLKGSSNITEQADHEVVYVGGVGVFERNGADAYQLAYAPLGNDARTVFDKGTPVTEYYIKDHLGSTRAIVNDQGEIVSGQDYAPYGDMSTTLAGSGTENRNEFTGKELDENSGMGLYYFGARYYDPEVGIWTTPDPAEEFFNSYSYVGGNVVNLVDPWGLYKATSHIDFEGSTVIMGDPHIPETDIDAEINDLNDQLDALEAEVAAADHKAAGEDKLGQYDSFESFINDPTPTAQSVVADFVFNWAVQQYNKTNNHLYYVPGVAASVFKDLTPQTVGEANQQLLMGGIGGKGLGKTVHATQRVLDGRNVKAAISDITKADTKFFIQTKDGAMVVRASGGREHIINLQTGKIITTINERANKMHELLMYRDGARITANSKEIETLMGFLPK